VRTRLQVPASMRTPPFDIDRELVVPTGFTISVYARVPGSRFMAFTPSGDLLVSQPFLGKVALVRPSASGGDPQVLTYAGGLDTPHDIVPRQIGGQWYIYVAERNKIGRFVYTPGDTTAGARQILVSNLPDASLPELHGTYGHQLKNIAVDSANRLYVSIGSAGNADPADVTANPERAAIHIYNPDGSGDRVFGHGIRNAEGQAFVPGTDDLWVVVNNRDNVVYPFDDGTGHYGQVYQNYVDDNPPELFTLVRDGDNYGWPFANSDPRSGLENMPYLPDYEFNRNGSVVDVNTFTRPTRGIQAHSAPLGLTFFQDTNLFARQWRNGVAVALHGSWNRQGSTGAKIIYFPWSAGRPGRQIDMVTGWIDQGGALPYWGRPVDVAVAPDGALYISDDQSGTIYKVTATTAP